MRSTDHIAYHRRRLREALRSSPALDAALTKVSQVSRIPDKSRAFHDKLEREYDIPIRRLRAEERGLIGTLTRHDIDPNVRLHAGKQLKAVRTRLTCFGRERNVFLRQNGIDFKYRVV